MRITNCNTFQVNAPNKLNTGLGFKAKLPKVFISELPKDTFEKASK